MSDKKAYAKPKMACPFCGTIMAVGGLSQHVRFKHPPNYEDFKENRESYIEKYKVDENTPEPEVQTSVETEEPTKVELEVNPSEEDGEKFLEEPDPEPEQFRIKQVKGDKPKPEPKKRGKPKTEKPESVPKKRGWRLFRRRN